MNILTRVVHSSVKPFVVLIESCYSHDHCVAFSSLSWNRNFTNNSIDRPCCCLCPTQTGRWAVGVSTNRDRETARGRSLLERSERGTYLLKGGTFILKEGPYTDVFKRYPPFFKRYPLDIWFQFPGFDFWKMTPLSIG